MLTQILQVLHLPQHGLFTSTDSVTLHFQHNVSLLCFPFYFIEAQKMDSLLGCNLQLPAKDSQVKVKGLSPHLESEPNTERPAFSLMASRGQFTDCMEDYEKLNLLLTWFSS